MTTLGTAQAHSTASQTHFFARWADMGTWSEWNMDTEWVRLDGPFETGATGVLKPKGGPKVPFVVASVIPGREFIDVSLLLGAKLTFAHAVTVEGDGCTIAVTVSMTGPMAWFWRMVLGKSLRASLQPDLDRLVATAEADALVASGAH
jgi:Polyketide cyclase / dehydrase and lipid transport